ncbi:MAG: hypothetical protein FJ096_09465 [Deltaproteobacteria bacterium]|nr:hypothetical protein [Deltaproteobacteria bacterium]
MAQHGLAGHDGAATSVFSRVVAAFSAEPKGVAALGHIDGRALRLELDVAAGLVRVAVAFATPLDLGLRLAPRSFTGPVDEEDPFEAAFALGGDEPGRVRDLVDEATREQLVDLTDSASNLALNDRDLTLVWTIEDVPDEPRLGASVRAASRTLASLERSARSLRSSVRLRAHADALASLAQAHGLSLELTPIKLWGELAGGAVVLRSERIGWHNHRFTLQASLPGPAPVTLRRKSLRDTVTHDGQATLDHGDAAFERRFQVDASSASDVLRDPELRRALLELDETVGAVSIDGDRVEVCCLAIEVRPSTLADAMLLLARVASRLRRS